MLVFDGFMLLTLMTNKEYFQGGSHKAPPLSRDLLVVDGHLGMSESQFPSGVWSMPPWMTLRHVDKSIYWIQ